MASSVGNYVIARESNIVRVDFNRKPARPAWSQPCTLPKSFSYIELSLGSRWAAKSFPEALKPHKLRSVDARSSLPGAVMLPLLGKSH